MSSFRRLFLLLCILLLAPSLAAAGEPAHHDHHAMQDRHASHDRDAMHDRGAMHDRHAMDDLHAMALDQDAMTPVLPDEGGAPATAARAAFANQPGCHASLAPPPSGSCEHTLTHACCVGAALTQRGNALNVTVPYQTEQNGLFLQLQLLHRAETIFHPPRHFS